MGGATKRDEFFRLLLQNELCKNSVASTVTTQYNIYAKKIIHFNPLLDQQTFTFQFVDYPNNQERVFLNGFVFTKTYATAALSAKVIRTGNYIGRYDCEGSTVWISI